MKKGLLLLLLGVLLLLCAGVSFAVSPSVQFETEKVPTFSVGWVGDMVPASDDIFNQNAFSGVRHLTTMPSLMIGNLEGTFAQEGRASKCDYLTDSCHAFRGGISFAYALKEAGFDFINLVNNHSYDYGDEGLADTEAVLDQVGIPYVSQTNPRTTLIVDGKKIGILGVSSTPPFSTITDYEYITKEISDLKKGNDIVILIFHGGAEGSDKTLVSGKDEYLGTENRGNVERVAHTAIDAGADIVLGSGPHVLRKTSYYKNKPVVYSAGNFVGGNQRLTTKGVLGVSGIFTITENNRSFKTSLISVLLSKEGIPSIDPLEQARILVESLAD